MGEYVSTQTLVIHQWAGPSVVAQLAPDSTPDSCAGQNVTYIQPTTVHAQVLYFALVYYNDYVHPLIISIKKNLSK